MRALILGDKRSLETQAIRSKLKSKRWDVNLGDIKIKPGTIVLDKLQKADLIVVMGSDSLVDLVKDFLSDDVRVVGFTGFWKTVETMPSVPDFYSRIKDCVNKLDAFLYRALNSPLKKGTYEKIKL